MAAAERTAEPLALTKAVFVPLAAAAFGAAGALFVLFLPRDVGATAAVAFWTVVTLGRGERGIVRWFPWFPLFGSLLAACTLLIRWYALVSLRGLTVLVAAIVAHELAAAGAVAVAWLARPADSEADRRLASLNSISAVLVFVQAAIVVAFTGLRMALILALLAYIVVRIILAFVNWRYNGVRWSDLTATFVVLSTLSLALLKFGDGVLNPQFR
jgi:hypothetical protein